jgi:hypothetical protein
MSHDLLDVVDKLGSGCGMLALFFLIAQNLRGRPRIRFEFSHSHFEVVPPENGSLVLCKYTFGGVLKNPSLGPNTITRVHLFVWANPKKTAYLRGGYGGVTMLEGTTKTPLALPVLFPPREAKSVVVICEFPLTGTADEKLIIEMMPLQPGSPNMIPKHRYELCFEDVNGTLYDADGRHINYHEANLRWTLPNAHLLSKKGKRFALPEHYLRIWRAKAAFRARLVFQSLGLWR